MALRVEGQHDEPPLPEPPDHDGELVVRRLADVPAETVTFLWRGRLPVGKLTAIGGDPGLGKSYITVAIAAPITRGVDLADVDIPDGRRTTAPGDVVLASFEDGAGDTLRPRAELLGADLERIHVIEGVRDMGGRVRPFCPADVERLEALLATLSRPRLMVIDPVGGWVGAGVDEYRGNEVRAALEGLRTLAAKYRLAVLLVMHLRKSAAHNALARLSGSGAYGQLVRSALLVGRHPDDDTTCALAHIKHNLSARQSTLGYRIDDDGLHWTGTVDLDGEQLAGHDDGDQRDAGDQALEFLVAELEGRSRPSRDIFAAARSVGINDKALRRAQKKLGIRAEKTSFDGPWHWVWPR